MKLLLTRPVDLGRGKVSYFGDVQIAGQRVFFLAANGREVAIIAGLKEPGKRSFREGNRLRFEYRAWPDGALKPGEAALVERFIIRLLRREDSMARDIAAREHEPVLGGALQVSSADTIDTIVITNPTDKSQPPQAIPIHIAERTRFTLQLMHWSAMVDLDPPPTDITALGRIQECILTVMTSHLLGIPLPVADTVVQKKTRNPAFAYFDLARPESNQQTIQHLQVTSDEHFVVSIEVPSKCDNHCLFCAVTGCDGPAKPIPEDHDILTRAVELLTALRPILSSVNRADVVFTGRDALNADQFVPLLQMFRREPRVARVTVVSPGTRLQHMPFVRDLAQAGLDGVMLTLLGPDASIHDTIAGRPGALRNLEQGLANLKQVGISWELNTVVVRENLACFPQTLEKAGRLGSSVRVYAYVSEPIVPLAQVARCAPRFSDFTAILAGHRTDIEPHVTAIHYVPFCLLPEWARPLSGHSSQSFPASPEELPPACHTCTAYGKKCGSVSSHYLELYGDTELQSQA